MLRALTIRAGYDPIEAWTGTWNQLTTDLQTVNPRLGEQVPLLHSEARARDDRAVAETALRVLARVCADHLHADHSGNYPIVPE